MLNLQTQRGCRFSLLLLHLPADRRQRVTRRVRPRSWPTSSRQLQRLGAKYVFIVDSIFNSSPRHVTEMCEAILRRNLKLPWGCFLRPQGLTPP